MTSRGRRGSLRHPGSHIARQPRPTRRRDGVRDAHFPEWAHYFADEGLASAFLVGERGALVGSLVAADQSRPQLWRQLLGSDSGSLGAVGVADTVRGRGVGSALLAHACDWLRDCGVGNCHISWTTLLSFYGRVGFLPWRRYETASREL